MNATSQNIKPIRILHVVGGMNRGGVETWLMHVLRHIDRDRFRINFVVHTTKPCAYDDEIRSFGSEIIPCLHPSRPWCYSHNFRRILRDKAPYDVVHSHVHHYSGHVLKLAHQAGIPYRICHSHNDTTDIDACSGIVRRSYLAFMKYWIERHASLGLACSKEAAVALYGSNWRSNPQRRILHYGVDLSPFCTHEDSKVIRAELGIPADAVVIGHVGRFSRQKNHGFLMRIFSRIAVLEPRAYLLLVGDGELRLDIENWVALAGLSDRVIFLGSRPDVPRLMAGAMDLFLMPSLHEGLPLVLIEAQAAGLPCVISSVISPETDIVDESIRRVPLSLTADKWAEETMSALTFSRRGPEALHAIQESRFNILSSIALLKPIYENL